LRVVEDELSDPRQARPHLSLLTGHCGGVIHALPQANSDRVVRGMSQRDGGVADVARLPQHRLDAGASELVQDREDAADLGNTLVVPSQWRDSQLDHANAGFPLLRRESRCDSACVLATDDQAGANRSIG
jgi:hypothetical protein